MRKKTQFCLAIDTASDETSVACVAVNGDYSVLQEKLVRGQGELLMDMIQRVLQQMNKTAKDLTCIAVTVGPGSFTGVRIGLATARGLGLALNIPVMGVDNFYATAYQLSCAVTVVLDTRRNDYFVQNFDKNGKSLSTATIMTADRLKQIPKLVACGSGALKLKEEINCKLVEHMPLALAVAKIALESPDKTVLPHPLYLRDADVTI